MAKAGDLESSRILLVDDDEVLQQLLQEFLTDQGYMISALSNGEALAGFLHLNSVDVIVMDILLPGEHGLYWLAWLKNNYPSLPVLILSSQKAVDDRIAGLQLGAEDYLIKPFHMTELLLRLKNILKNKRPIELKANHSYTYCFDPEHALFFRDGKTIKLTTTETRLMRFLFDHAGKIVTRDEISEALRGNSHHPLDRSIDVHMNRLRKKIEDKPNLPKYLNTVWGKGYRFLPPKKEDELHQ
ncbi:response regulator transcription factor [uncultured Thiothrix sp.]|uniref:response regulator transcription factor n=1 Tax=uncultured Thiothrix sp. TaxID=223185 RepID=UPI0026381499|nr:response regulator transcription factor [uncultured Thiothrix sp.]